MDSVKQKKLKSFYSLFLLIAITITSFLLFLLLVIFLYIGEEQNLSPADKDALLAFTLTVKGIVAVSLLVLAYRVHEIDKQRTISENIIMNIGDGLVVTNSKGKIEMVNEAFTKMIGMNEPQLMSEQIYDVLNLTDEIGGELAEKKNPIKQSYSKKKSMRVGLTDKVFFLKDKNLDPIPLQIGISPLITNKKFQGAVLLVRDISKEVKFDNAKSEFVSLASHQLRTPVTTVRWDSELLLKGDAGKLNKEQTQYVEEISAAADRTISLINALLNASKLELGFFKINPQKVNPARELKKIIDEMRPQIRRNKLKIEHELEKDLPEMPIDSDLFSIIFQNLISNAIKYTPSDGTLKFEIELVKQGSAILKDKKIPFDGVLFEISDTGLGIPEEQQSHIFKKLFRADNIKHTDTTGAGLGLYTVKSILDEIGGEIWFESEEDNGTTFYVLFPKEGMIAREGLKVVNYEETE